MNILVLHRSVRRQCVRWLKRALLLRLTGPSMRTSAAARSRTTSLRMQRYISMLVATAMVVGGCNDASGPADPAPVEPVASVAVAPATIELSVGETRQVTATPKDAQGKALQRSVSWRSSNTAVATIDDSGMVRAVGAGAATIVAASGGVEGHAVVAVSAVSGEIELSKDTLYFVGVAGIVTPAPQTLHVQPKQGVVNGLVAEVEHVPGSAAGWLAATLSAPDAPASLAVTATTGLLLPGIHLAEISVRSTADSAIAAKRVRVVFEVQPGPEKDISASDRHSCAVDLTGQVFCWGYNGSRQLAIGSMNNYENRAQLLPGGHRFLRISTGELHACGIRIDGDALCWGSGYMGDGTTGTGLAPRVVAGGHKWTHLATGYRHSCGITTDGDTYCWGANNGGQLGDNGRVDRSQPVKLASGLRFVSLTAGAEHTCGVTANGDGYCWGRTAYGRLGVHSTSTDAELTPVAIGGGRKWASLSAGQLYTCGITSAGEAFCWGYNSAAQLGDDSRTGRSTPTAVSTNLRFSAIAAGRNHTCAIATNGTTWCWGYRQHGGVGDGNNVGYQLVPTQVLGGIQFRRITAANNHSCGVTATDDAYCWGYNGLGAIGDGTIVDRLQPVRIDLD